MMTIVPLVYILDTPMLNAIEINILKGLKRNWMNESKCEGKREIERMSEMQKEGNLKFDGR